MEFFKPPVISPNIGGAWQPQGERSSMAFAVNRGRAADEHIKVREPRSAIATLLTTRVTLTKQSEASPLYNPDLGFLSSWSGPETRQWPN